MGEESEGQEIIEKYRKRLVEEISGSKFIPSAERKISTEEYKKFKRQFLPRHLSYYEQLCNIAGSLLKLKISPEEERELREAISVSHLETTPQAVIALSYLGPLVFALVGGVLTYAIFQAPFFIMYFIVAGLLLSMLLRKMPLFFANSWRLKASNQMVQCIFYVVTYMRHTSNFENALEFAAEHLAPPLCLDLRKVLWDVETGKYDGVKPSLDAYLETWRRYNLEFIEAFHLVESSLFEPSEERRLALIEKALEVILGETYEKMLHYTHELRSPISTLHMLGIILPILGLVILPMLTSFMTNSNTTPGRMALYISVLYNITIPVIVIIFGRIILTKRPTGYGENDISNEFPSYQKYKNILIKVGNSEIKINPIFIAALIGGILVLIGLFPLIYGWVTPKDTLMREGELFMGIKMFDYRTALKGDDAAAGERIIGPYGVGAAMLSVVFTAGLGLGIGFYYQLRSQNVIKIREETKKLENEFASGLFQLGNRIGDGIPAEMAFQSVAEIMKDTRSGEFFRIVSHNVVNRGMSLEDAIFNKDIGALAFFPSNVIKSSMKVMLESSRKGPQVCSRTLLTVAEYIKEIHRVNEKLKDLMADIISDMKQQITFIAPVISGIVIGITTMIVNILGQLRVSLTAMNEASGDIAGAGMNVLGMFGDGVPGFFFQIIVGVYVVEIVYIMTTLVNGIENGSDRLTENFLKGQNLVRSTTLYCFITFFGILLLNLIVNQLLPAITDITSRSV